jgi:catalase
MYIPLNQAAYSPNTLNNGFPQQANQTVGKGFFTAPGRSASGKLLRSVSPTFADVWSQPRLFFNSLIATERQFLVNAIRFELAHVASVVVKQNMLIQLNRVSHNLAQRVARAIGMTAPAPDQTFYHNNKTSVSLGAFGTKLLKLEGLKVAILATATSASSFGQLKSAFLADGVDTIVVAEYLTTGVDATYSASDATLFDGIIVGDGAEKLFTDCGSGKDKNASLPSLFPTGRPSQILLDGFRYGKPIGALGSGASVLQSEGITGGKADGVYTGPAASGNSGGFVSDFKDGLKTFKFLQRFGIDDDAE